MDPKTDEVLAGLKQGKTVTAIAKATGLTTGDVLSRARELHNLWLASCVHDVDQARREQIQRLDLVEDEAWAAWQRSLKPTRVTVKGKKEGDFASTTHEDKTLKSTSGDPKWLEIVIRCVETKSRLLGLFQDKLTLTGANNKPLFPARVQRLYHSDPEAMELAMALDERVSNVIEAEVVSVVPALPGSGA